MAKNILFISAFSLLAASMAVQTCCAKETCKIAAWKNTEICTRVVVQTDTTAPADVMAVITAVIYATNNFNIEAVANLYTPNAVVADDEPPYSWNGPTAGIQWVNAVEQVCKDNQLTKLKATMEPVKVYQQTTDNIYIVVPVSYTGNLPGRSHFTAKEAFTFVLRMVNDKWLIKCQVWMPRQGM